MRGINIYVCLSFLGWKHHFKDLCACFGLLISKIYMILFLITSHYIIKGPLGSIKQTINQCGDLDFSKDKDKVLSDVMICDLSWCRWLEKKWWQSNQEQLVWWFYIFNYLIHDLNKRICRSVAIRITKQIR